MSLRNEFITQTSKQLDYYIDFTDNILKHPVTNQIVTLTNEEAVTQSIKNLVLTNQGEWPFRPDIGCNIRRALFDHFGPFLIEDLTNAIRDTIRHSEPRANLLQVNIYEAEGQNSIGVNIIFTIINHTQPISLDLILKRVR